jgi:hypothetical protein
MIVPFGKHLRTWFLGLAVAARNRIQAIVAGLASVEETQTKKAEREIATGGAKTARPGGPPEHWVRLVRRHAPELLQATPPDVVTRTRSAVFENDAGVDGSAPQDIRDLRSDSGAPGNGDLPTDGDLSYSSSHPRAPQAYDDPGGRRQAPAQDDKRQAGEDDRIAGGDDSASGGHFRDGAAPPAATAARPGPVKAGRLAGSPAGKVKKMPGRTSGRVRNERSVPVEGPETGTRQVQIPDSRPAAARRFQSTIGPIEDARAGEKDRENIPVSEQSGRRGEQSHRRAPEHAANVPFDTRKPVDREIKRDTGYDTQAEPGDFFKELGPSPGTGVEAPAALIKGSRDDPGHVTEVRIINDQRAASRPHSIQEAVENTSPPAKLNWPSLPGEKDSEDAGDSQLTATWPRLSEERSAEVTSSSNQVEPHPSEERLHNIDRLRRLDEEQKGRPWSASHS